jgi:SH3-like domain-containing protein
VSRARHKRARHRAVEPKSSSALPGSRYVQVGAAGAVIAGLTVGGAALAKVADETPDKVSAQQLTSPGVTPTLTTREQRTSRSQTRATIAPKPSTKPTTASTPTATLKAIGSRYATAALNVRVGPGKHSAVADQLDEGSKVAITGETSGDWVQVLVDGKVGWVHSEYLSKTKPGISMAPCDSGSAVETGLRDDTIRVHRAVCALWNVESYGGLRGGGGEHALGRALDIMITDSSQGKAIAEWVRDHAKELGVSEVIWAQHIWTVQRSSEGWRMMEDRGGVTANHYDHVHVTTYGDAGTLSL